MPDMCLENIDVAEYRFLVVGVVLAENI